MKTLYNKISWIEDGERVLAEVLNRPLQHVTTLIDKMDFDTVAKCYGFPIELESLEVGVIHGSFVYKNIQTGLYTPALAIKDPSSNIVGMYIFNNGVHQIITSGYVYGINLTFNAGETYYLSGTNPGELSLIAPERKIQLGYALSSDVFLIYKDTKLGSADIFEKILKIDGAKSKLDGDFLDGFNSTIFCTAEQFYTITEEYIINTILSVDGADSGLDADLLDGIKIENFIPREDLESIKIDINSLKLLVRERLIKATLLITAAIATLACRSTRLIVVQDNANFAQIKTSSAVGGIINVVTSTVAGLMSADQKNTLENADTIYAKKDSQQFTGIATLPSTSEIGRLNEDSWDFLSTVTSDVQDQIDDKADLDSEQFTGIPTVPTPNEGDNSDKIANVEFLNKECVLLSQIVTDRLNAVSSTPTPPPIASGFGITAFGSTSNTLNESIIVIYTTTGAPSSSNTVAGYGNVGGVSSTFGSNQGVIAFGMGTSVVLNTEYQKIDDTGNVASSSTFLTPRYFVAGGALDGDKGIFFGGSNGSATAQFVNKYNLLTNTGDIGTDTTIANTTLKAVSHIAIPFGVGSILGYMYDDNSSITSTVNISNTGVFSSYVDFANSYGMSLASSAMMDSQQGLMALGLSTAPDIKVIVSDTGVISVYTGALGSNLHNRWWSSSFNYGGFNSLFVGGSESSSLRTSKCSKFDGNGVHVGTQSCAYYESTTGVGLSL